MTEEKGEYNLSPSADAEDEIRLDLIDLLRVAVEKYTHAVGSVMSSEWFHNIVLVQIAMQLEQLNRNLKKLTSNTRNEG